VDASEIGYAGFALDAAANVLEHRLGDDITPMRNKRLVAPNVLELTLPNGDTLTYTKKG
jgi:hypothetical protein